MSDWRMIQVDLSNSLVKELSWWQLFWGIDIFVGEVPVFKLFLFVDLLIQLFV